MKLFRASAHVLLFINNGTDIKELSHTSKISCSTINKEILRFEKLGIVTLQGIYPKRIYLTDYGVKVKSWLRFIEVRI